MAFIADLFSEMACLKKIIFLFLFAVTGAYAQGPYHIQLETSSENCVKASASLSVSGQGADPVKIVWSTGAVDTMAQTNLAFGIYYVNVKITHTKDSVMDTRDTAIVHVKDTTITFGISKEECGVAIEKCFTPNGDAYNDVLGISNINRYPDFELNVYNRWGQRVHHQQSVYTPWDGKWLGVDLPDGAYFYVFFYSVSDRTRVVKGDVTILR